MVTVGQCRYRTEPLSCMRERLEPFADHGHGPLVHNGSGELPHLPGAEEAHAGEEYRPFRMTVNDESAIRQVERGV